MPETYLLQTPKDVDNFKDILKQTQYLLVKASAPWCNPCIRIEAPVKELFKSQLNENVKVMYIDVDEHEEIASELNITKIPAFITIVNGKIANSDITSNMKDVITIIDRINSHAILG
jgi:thiol-disulfide isomerase/thioredoxin